jgi:hypothetical protein
VGEMMNLSVPCQPPVCAACQQGKMKALPYPPILECCHKPFECIHSDLVPLNGISFGKSKHMLIFINDYTWFVWVYFTSSANVPAVSLQIEGFIFMIQTQFDVRIKCWRTNGSKGKFINSIVTEINHCHRILHESSTSAVKQQNGLVKQYIQTLKNMEHSIHAGAGILDDY